MSNNSSPSKGPANNGIHTVRRNPNGGLLADEYADLRQTSEAVRSDPEAAAWMQQHQSVWLQHGRRR